MSRKPVGGLLQTLLLSLMLLPAGASSLLLPDLLHRPPTHAGLLAWRAALAFPVIALPLLLALSQARPWQTRAAIGLGAGWLDRMRWIWLPQFGPSLALSVLLALLFALGTRLID